MQVFFAVELSRCNTCYSLTRVLNQRKEQGLVSDRVIAILASIKYL